MVLYAMGLSDVHFRMTLVPTLLPDPNALLLGAFVTTLTLNGPSAYVVLQDINVG